MTATRCTSAQRWILFAVVAVAAMGTAQARDAALTEEMNAGLQMSPLNQVVLPLYARAEHCGATESQLAALKKRFRDGTPELPATMPGEIFDAFFERNLPAARSKVQARMASMAASEKAAACDQPILPEA